MFVRYSCFGGLAEARRFPPSAPNAFTMRWPANVFGGEMRDVLELFLAAAGRSAHALSQTHERVHDERRGHDHDERQPPVELEQQRGVADHGQRLA